MMNTIDQTIKEYSQKRSLRGVNQRTDEILNSLSKQLNANVYLTQRQADLALKILNDNQTHFSISAEDLKNPVWEKQFRVIELFKYLHLVKPQGQDRYFLELGFNHNKNLTKSLDELRKKGLTNPLMRIKNNVWQIIYTEKDLYRLVNLVLKHNFEISPEILETHREISEILKTSKQEKVYIDLNCHEHLKNSVTAEIGNLEKTNILLEDRKIRFQYEIFDSFFQKKENLLLEEKIALRKEQKIYIPSSEISLSDIMGALQKLQRLPALVIFDNHHEKSMKILENLHLAVTDNNITDPIGIYFRHDNDENGKPFNELVTQLAYNQPLNNNTAVVGITNLKIPKFLLKMRWMPKSVIVMSSVFSANRVNLYTQSCDLVIFYQDKKPLRETVEEIV